MTRALLICLVLSACVDDGLELDEVESDVLSMMPVTAVTNDVPVTVSLPANAVTYFKLDVPAGFDRVSVAPYGFSGAPRVWVRRNQLPTATSYDCTSTHLDCQIEMPIAGTYYIGIQTTVARSVSFVARYRNDYAPISNNYSNDLYNQYGYDVKYKLVVPANVSSVTFKYVMEPGSLGSLDLVVKRNGFANDQNYDCFMYIDGRNGWPEGTCTFANPTPGTYYIGLLGHSSKTVGTFSARYRYALANAPATTAFE